MANIILEDDFLSYGNSKGLTKYYKIQSKSSKAYYTINIQKRSCSCALYLKIAICKHALAFSNFKDMGWFGSKYSIKNREFHIKNKRGAKKRRKSY